ncbi:PREDICTED: reticulon-4-interacting protein 1 homolog, mitochondrial-like isoform X2 [Polistes canadensis]|uniref:reticulon-4-interacting protein 1 homolog, mitochondrial-like isoform X2 n=1 Tax=Polistes canadensis TaxID=91411 RepID=UPI000718EF32|nr:PREDICTED: reticulon-4-interacting protein 1 homolog, mitochondrial-like isoform X2 [Polistes canadensis]
MDEIYFRITNHLEILQKEIYFSCLCKYEIIEKEIWDKVQASLAIQQGQQWVSALLTYCQRYIQELSSDQHVQYMKDIIHNLLTYIKKSWEQLHFKYYSIHINFTQFYQQLPAICANEVTRREIIFCLAGISIGTLIGYIIGRNWIYYSHHMHYIKAIICHHYIGTEGVSMIDDAEMPTIRKSNDLLIQVKAASVNVVDTKICSGYSKAYRRLLNSRRHKDIPIILGRDCSGIVIDIGQSVINFDIGDEVFLAVPSWAPGTMAEYITVPETQVVKRPKRCTHETAASIPYSGCMAWDALVNKSIIKEGNAKGQRVLIYGGNTPVGCILIQLVKLWGGYVVTASRQNALPVMRALGADEVLSLNESNIEKELELHDNGQLTESHILKKYLHPHGSFVTTMPEHLMSDSLGFISGSIFAGCVRIKLLIQYIFGCNIHQWKEGSKIKVEYLQALSELTDADEIQPVVDRVYTPHNIEEALHHILDPDAIGSTIIKF